MRRCCHSFVIFTSWGIITPFWSRKCLHITLQPILYCTYNTISLLLHYSSIYSVVWLYMLWLWHISRLSPNYTALANESVSFDPWQAIQNGSVVGGYHITIAQCLEGTTLTSNIWYDVTFKATVNVLKAAADLHKRVIVASRVWQVFSVHTTILMN